MAAVIHSDPNLEFSISPFCQLAQQRLNRPSPTDISGRQFTQLSGMLELSAYLYECGALLGRARGHDLKRMLRSLVDPRSGECDVWSLRWSLKARLERTRRECKSLYTFYLDLTMRKIGLEFSLEGMQQAHSLIRTTSEMWWHLDRAGAEGLMLGASFPDLAAVLFNKEFDSCHPVVQEMYSKCGVRADSAIERDVDKRAKTLASLLKLS